MFGALEGLLTVDAVHAYERLLSEGEAFVGVDEDLPASMRELIERGFAWLSETAEHRRIVPTEPALAIEFGILSTHRHIAEHQAAILRARMVASELQRTYGRERPAGDASDQSIRLTADVEESRSTVAALRKAACSEILDVGQLAVDQAFAVAQDGTASAPIRWLLPKSALEDAAANCLELARDVCRVRVSATVPGAMSVIDRSTALVPLGSAPDRLMVIREPALVDMLAFLFERLWAHAVPLAGAESPTGRPITSNQRRVLSLLLTGMTDAAIARHMGVSERTVRRYVSDLLSLLGADNRVTAAAIAVRDGWLR